MSAIEHKSRITDPATSKAAGASQTPDRQRASHARVLAMFRLYGDMHDKQLQEVLDDACRQAGLKPMSPSGVRSRRSELSKPNMDRLAEIIAEVKAEQQQGSLFKSSDEAIETIARERLRIEGFRSLLWDTGKREVIDGYPVTVWGIAK